MTTEDDFHRLIDDNPTDWHSRLVFADWLEDRGDARAAGYRALALQRRRPLQGRNGNSDAWWWHRPPAGSTPEITYNNIPADWFRRLPRGFGSEFFWPAFNVAPRNLTRRECEDALARAFAELPAARQAELLTPRPEDPPEKPRRARRAGRTAAGGQS